MKLHYKAVTNDGKPVLGQLDAKTIPDAALFLKKKGLVPVTIEEKTDFIGKTLSTFNKTHRSDLVFFTRQLSSMISSGITLSQALVILKDQIKNPNLTVILEGIIGDIQEGRSFSQAIEKYPEVFSSIYVSLIKASEESGLLDKVLFRLADNLEKQEKLRGTVKSALLYPIIVIIGMIILVFIMMIFVIPQISTLYSGLKVELPLPTQIIIGLSNFFVNFWWLLIGSGIGLFVGFNRWHHTVVGQKTTDRILLRLPIIGKLIRESILTEFSRTFGLMVGTGTLIIEALGKTSEITGNILYKEAIQNMSKLVEKGVTVGDAMTSEPLFPPVLVEMVRVGEQTGKLDESLLRVSEYFEREVDQAVKNITTAIEPFIIIVLGIGVAFLVISILLPIYGLISSF